MKALILRNVDSLKVTENLPFLSDLLFLADCEGLERVSDLPQLRELRTGGCPNVRCVEKLSNLMQLGLHMSMHLVSSSWMPGLEQQCKELHGEELDVYDWI